jgi:predicted O-linked N-acetylglucosamine transferase (SPINDLY family)
MVQIREKFESALALHQRGQLAQARTIYEEILEVHPSNFDVLHLLGVIAAQTADPGRAVQLIGRAIEIDSTSAAAHFNRGTALQELKQLDAALADYNEAVAIDAAFAEAFCNRAIVLKELKQLRQALESSERAIALKRDLAEAHFNRGAILYELGHLDAALASYHAAVLIKSTYAEAHFNRAVVLGDLDQLEAALVSYDSAIANKEGYVAAYANRGNVLRELRQWEAALDSYNQALAIKPDDAVTYCNRGNVLRELRRWDAALASYEKSVELDPELVEAHFNRADALRELQKYEAATLSFQRAIALKPDIKFADGLLLNTRMYICDWNSWDIDIAKIAERTHRNEPATNPFCVLSFSDCPRLQREAAELWVQSEHPSKDSMPSIPKRSRHEKTRIGYFSGDYRNHAVSILTAGLFETHDRSKFEMHAFSFGPDTKDEMRQRMQRSFDRFLDVRDQSDQEIARLARSMEIDIALDLGGYTGGCRPGIFARRAAPLQVSYLGYPGTTGAPYMDYLIADKTVMPDGNERHYSEKIIYMPHSYMANDRTRGIADRAFTREEFGLPRDGVVFCCFNSSHKITPSVFDGWMRILERVPGSVLWLSETNDAAARNLREAASRRDVQTERLIFAKRMPGLPEHLGRLRMADLFLDTRPFNAHTTASDALWAGLPVLTCTGNAFASRVAASLLQAIGLPELVAASQDEYEELAVKLASNPQRLNQITEALSANRLAFPLFDTRLFTTHLERAYTMIYERYQADLPPDHIYVSAD